MSALLCPRCQRANPGEARFCHFDGAELNLAPGSPFRGYDLGREFVFPSGRRCKTYDDLVRGCSEEWNAARSMLKQGGLRQFLAGIGRMDLALMADRCAAEADMDVGLDQFLSQLPARDLTGPRLDLAPRRLNLGKLKVGESRQYQLSIINQGTRLLHGTLQIEGEDWISFGEGAARQVPIKTGKQQQVALSIDTFGLVAGQRYAARLTVITNGGIAEVPVTMDLAPTLFPHAPLQGAASPRELASKMKDVPKQAAPLLESGEVQRWFAANGWRYPVQGPTAKGVAAVQQFFEGMGVSKPPPLTLSDEEVLMVCRSGQSVRGKVALRTSAKKWVYARAESDASWLVIENPDVGGAQQAIVEFETNAEGLPGGKRFQGHLTILANGGQRFQVLIHADIRAAPLRVGRDLTRALIIGVLLGLVVRGAGSLPDLLGRGWLEFGGWLTNAPEDFLLHYVQKFTLLTAWIGIPLGMIAAWRRGSVKDVPAGLLVGGVTGLLVSASLGCLFPVIDGWLHPLIPWRQPGAAIAGWTLATTVAVLPLGLLGSWGRHVVGILGSPFAAAARFLGLEGAAKFLQGEQ